MVYHNWVVRDILGNVAVVVALSFYEVTLWSLIFDDTLVLFHPFLILSMASRGVPLLNDLRHTEHGLHLCLSLPSQHHLTQPEVTLLKTYNFQQYLLGTSIVVHGISDRVSYFYQNGLLSILKWCWAQVLSVAPVLSIFLSFWCDLLIIWCTTLEWLRHTEHDIYHLKYPPPLKVVGCCDTKVWLCIEQV